MSCCAKPLKLTSSPFFVLADFPSLSGARIVRIAVHPEMARAGYGSRAVELLKRYYSGQLAGLDDDLDSEADEGRDGSGGGRKKNGTNGVEGAAGCEQGMHGIWGTFLLCMR